MPEYTPEWNLPFPKADESVLPESRDFEDLARAVDSGLTSAVGKAGDEVPLVLNRGSLPEGTDLTDFGRHRSNNGYWHVGPAVATTITGWPEGIVRAPAAVQVEATDTVGIITIMEIGKPYSWVGQSLSQVWRGWTGTGWDRGLLSGGTDLNDVIAFGVYGCGYSSITNRPTSPNGILEVFPLGVAVMQRYTTIRGDQQQEMYVRRGASDGSSWYNWSRIDVGAASAPEGGGSDALARRDLLQADLVARKGGAIGTGGRGVVALRFDDGAGDFARDVLPLLAERGLPFTRVTTVDRVGGTIGGEDDTWANIQDYTLDHGGEVWNHGKTHQDATGDTALYAEIVGALETLRTNLPNVPIDCFTPPGLTGWDGHLPSNTTAAWSDTFAGQIIIGHHALASGYMPATYYRPLDGRLKDGQRHYSVDGYTATRGQQLIDRARDWTCGLVMMWHANNLDEPGNMTLSELEQVLDYLVTQQEAGNLLVLTVSGLALADAGSDWRDDVLTTSSGDPFAATITMPQHRQNLPGSTRVLSATVTGTASTTVTSTVGTSTMSHTIPAGGTLQLRHAVTIPLDVSDVETPFTVTIDAATTNATLYAV